MNYNHLKYFQILAKHENYTLAAQEIRISQPSLSYAMKQLETDLEIPLFERKGRNIQLTAYGKILQTSVNENLANLESSLKEIKQLHEQTTNVLALGIVPTLASHFIPKMIRAGREQGYLTQKHQSFHGFSAEICDKIHREIYDVGFCSRYDDPDVCFHEVQHQFFTLLVRKELLAESELTIADYFQLPLITYRGSTPIGKKARELITFYNPEATIIEELDDETTIGGFVAENLGVGVVAETSLLKQFELERIALPHQDIYHTVYLSYLKKRAEEPKIATFVDFTLNYVKQLDDSAYESLL